MTPQRMSRRRMLTLLGVGALATVTGCTSRGADAAAGAAAGPLEWHDPGAWPQGRIPGPQDEVVVSRDTVLRADAHVASCRVESGATLTFAADVDVVLTLEGNLVVEGRLQLRPDAGRQHGLAFADVVEDRVVGGGHEPLPTDVGLWCVGSGVLELVGGARTPWGELAATAHRGDRALALTAPPQGWRVGDELVICPTAAPSAGDAHQAFERCTVTRVDGATVHLDRQVQHDHPLLTVPGRAPVGGEVLNLTRDVRIGGSAAGRAHVLISSDRAQTITQVQLHDMGPQRLQGVHDDDGAEVPTPILGRYGLHFHHCGGAIGDSDVEGVVVTAAGNHAFVAHESDGLRFRGCVSYDTVLAAYWWDAVDGDDATSDVRYESCVAALVDGIDAAVDAETAPLVQRVGGFDLLRGRGNVATGCRAVGVRGGRDSGGFTWQEEAEGQWAVVDCVAHNNRHHGAFIWLNSQAPHHVERLVSYHNGEHGIVNGAYANGFHFSDCVAWGNAGYGVLRQANAIDGRRQEWEGCLLDPAGEGTLALFNGPHEFPPRVAEGDVVFRDCRFGTGAQGRIAFFDATDIRSWCAVDFVDCGLSDADVLTGRTYPGTSITIDQDGARRAVLAAPAQP